MLCYADARVKVKNPTLEKIQGIRVRGRCENYPPPIQALGYPPPIQALGKHSSMRSAYDGEWSLSLLLGLKEGESLGSRHL